MKLVKTTFIFVAYYFYFQKTSKGYKSLTHLNKIPLTDYSIVFYVLTVDTIIQISELLYYLYRIGEIWEKLSPLLLSLLLSNN